jgi:hypothetical protein
MYVRLTIATVLLDAGEGLSNSSDFFSDLQNLDGLSKRFWCETNVLAKHG